MTVKNKNTTSHCTRCGKNLLAGVGSDMCYNCNFNCDSNICIGMKKFSKDLNQILRGFYYLDKDVGYEWIKSSLKNIQISKNGCCCDKCSACNTFLGIKEIFATGYTTINLTQNIKKLEIYLERVKKDNQSSE